MHEIINNHAYALLFKLPNMDFYYSVNYFLNGSNCGLLVTFEDATLWFICFVGDLIAI